MLFAQLQNQVHCIEAAEAYLWYLQTYHSRSALRWRETVLWQLSFPFQMVTIRERWIILCSHETPISQKCIFWTHGWIWLHFFNFLDLLLQHLASKLHKNFFTMVFAQFKNPKVQPDSVLGQLKDSIEHILCFIMNTFQNIKTLKIQHYKQLHKSSLSK